MRFNSENILIFCFLDRMRISESETISLRMKHEWAREFNFFGPHNWRMQIERFSLNSIKYFFVDYILRFCFLSKIIYYH